MKKINPPPLRASISRCLAKLKPKTRLKREGEAPTIPEKRKAAWWKSLISLLAIILLLTGLIMAFPLRNALKGSGGPEEVVKKYFQAMEEHDEETLVNLLDPQSLEEEAGKAGLDPEELRNELKTQIQNTLPEGIRFSDLDYDIEVTGDEAKVVFKSGVVSYPNEEGENILFDITEAQETPRLVKRGGRWYLKLGG